jgi:hypothetical protein
MSMTSLRVYPNGTGSSSPAARVVVLKPRVDRVLTLSTFAVLFVVVVVVARILAEVGALIVIFIVVVVIIVKYLSSYAGFAVNQQHEWNSDVRIHSFFFLSLNARTDACALNVTVPLG